MLIMFPSIISFSAFFYSLDVFSLSQGFFFFYNTELKNIWSPPGIEPQSDKLVE